MSNSFFGHFLQRAISEDELPNMPEVTNSSDVYGDGGFGASLGAGELAGLVTGAGGACNSAR